MITHWINELAARLWPASLTLAGQAAVLVVMLLIAERVFRRRLPAAWAAALWMLVLVRLVLPPGLQSPTSVCFWLGPWLAAPIWVTAPTPVAPLASVEQVSVAPPKLASASVASALAPAPAPAQRLSRSGWLLLGWGVGSLICLGWMVRKNQEVRRLVGLSTEASAEANAALRRVAAEIGLRRLPRLRLTSQDHSPAVWGWFQPVVLLPQALADSLSPAGLRDVLAHELIHLRRGDLWLNLPQAFLQAIWWWNPVVWLATARIRMWREQAVDDAVMALSREEDASYPQTLVEVARFCAARPTVSLGFVGILESRRSVRYRVLRLVNAPPARRTRLGWAGWIVVLLVAVLALPMAFARRVENGAVHNGTNDVGTITGAPESGQPWVEPSEGYLEADEITIDRANNRLTARGNFKMIINPATAQNPTGSVASSTLRPLEIQVSSDGFEVGGQQMEPEEFARRLSQEKSINPERSVSLGADTGVEWSQVIRALDFVKRAGFTNNVKAFTRPGRVRTEGLSPKLTAALGAEPIAVRTLSPQIESTRTLPGSSPSESSEWLPWSPEAVENALAVGRPVLVLVTAKWDTSGRSFRETLMESIEVRDRLDELKALRLEADWTRPDPMIEGLLKQYQRAGVPLALWYYPGAAPVVVEVGAGVESLLEAMAPSAGPVIPAIQIEVEELGGDVRYRIQGREVSQEELRERLAELGRTAPETALRIRFREGGGFGSVLEVMEWSRSSGLSKFNLVSLGDASPFPAAPSNTARLETPLRSAASSLPGLNRASLVGLLKEFGLTWSEFEQWAGANKVAIDSVPVEELRTLLLQRTPVSPGRGNEQDSLPSRWITVRMIEVGVGRFELRLDQMQVETLGGTWVFGAGTPFPRLNGGFVMSGVMDLGRWKALEQEIVTQERVSFQKRLTGRQDWGLSPVDSPANHGEKSGGPSDLISIQSAVRSDSLALNITVRPGKWSALSPDVLGRWPELRGDLVLQEGQVGVVACLDETSGGERSPRKLILLTTQTNEP